MILGINRIPEFKTFIDCVYEETDTIVFECSDYGVIVRVLGKSHTCFYTVEFEKDFFLEYGLDEPAEVVTVFVEDLYNILKTAGKNDYLELKSDKIHITAKFIGEHNTRVFEFVQPDFDTESSQPPVIDVNASAVVGFSDWKQSLSDLDIFKAGVMKIVFDENTLTFTTPDNSLVTYKNTITPDEIGGVAEAMFSVEFLKRILEFNKINDTFTVGFNTDAPLLWNVNGESIKVKGLIAPRLGEED